MARRLTVVRHGERVDFTFGEAWIQTSFDSNGKYIKTNLNMPDDVPKRDGRPQKFLKDCPLTQVGNHQALLTGKGLAREKTFINDFEVYVSPALRSVETASSILKGMGISKPLKIEPCLFEWTGWYPEANPSWMSLDELSAAGFNIDKNYESFYKYTDVIPDESVEMYYIRTNDFTNHILAQHDKDVLFVAHGATLDTATRQLTGGAIRSLNEMMTVLRGVPYCGLATVEATNSSWDFHVNPFLTMRHMAVSEFEAAKSFVHQ